MTRRTLTSWEAETLHKMSEAYAIQAMQASHHDCMSPWKPKELTSEAVASKVLAFFEPKTERAVENKLALKIPKPPKAPRNTRG